MRPLIPVSAVSLVLTIALLWVAMTVVGSVGAATLIVTNTADSGAGSLRATIAAASDGDTIQFDPALNGQNITLTSNELAIDKDITSSGPGPDLLAVVKTPSQPPHFGIFHVRPAHTVIIEGLTISRGYYGGGSGVNNDQGTLTISNGAISGNFSDAGGGGGGIFNTGTLIILDSVISDNFAVYNTGNPVGYGGGIHNADGTLSIINSTITRNTAALDGGGICAPPAGISRHFRFSQPMRLPCTIPIRV